jgi:hypothetical protein
MIEKEFDMYIPVVRRVGAIKNLIVKIVEESSDGAFKDDGCKHLYYKSNGVVLDENQYVKQSDIKNGTRLVLY